MTMEDQDKITALVTRDPVLSIMFAVAVMLIVLDGAFASIAAHTKNVEILKLPMFATAVFAAAGIVLGLARSLIVPHPRSGGGGPRNAVEGASRAHMPPSSHALRSFDASPVSRGKIH
jgi:hypothetical protein